MAKKRYEAAKMPQADNLWGVWDNHDDTWVKRYLFKDDAKDLAKRFNQAIK